MPKMPKMPEPSSDAPSFNDQDASMDQLRDERDAVLQQNAQMLQLIEELNAKFDQLQSDVASSASRDRAAQTERDRVQAEMDAELSDLMKEFSDYPQISVFEQRVLTGIDASVDIRLKGDLTTLEDPTGERCRWKLRFFNFAKEGRAQQAAAEGYVKVAWDELQDMETMVAGGVKSDQYVRRGERGLEVLHKIPMKLFAYKKRRDALRAEGKLESESAVRDMLADRVGRMAAAEMGGTRQGDAADQAGSLIADRSRFITSVKRGETERVSY